jgi:hypothetical protein
MRNWAAGVAGIVAVVVGAGLAACSEGYPESPTAATSSAADVCESADDLRASLTALGDVQVVQEGTDAVQEAWTTVQDDWAQLAKVAGDEYADQVDRVEADGGALQSAIETTQEDPSAEALRQVAAAVQVFVQDAGALTDEVKSTC